MLNNTKYVRTTISIADSLLFAVKKKALEERKTITELINEGLSSFINTKLPDKSSPKIADLYGAWGEGLSGSSYLGKTRYCPSENKRETYLSKLWKKY